MNDEFIDEVNAIRRKTMEECGNELHELGNRIKRSQDEDPTNLVDEAAVRSANTDDPLAEIRIASGIGDLAEHFDDYRFGRRNG